MWNIPLFALTICIMYYIFFYIYITNKPWMSKDFSWCLLCETFSDVKFTFARFTSKPNLESSVHLSKFHNIKMNNGLRKLVQCQAPKAECLSISQSTVCKGNWFILMSHWSTENGIVCLSADLWHRGWRDSGNSRESSI